MAFGQQAKERSEIEHILGTKIDHKNQAKADAEAEKILDNYIALDEFGARLTVDNMDDSWFDTVYSYINTDFSAIKEGIKEDRQFDKSKITTVSVVKKDNTYVVLILLL
jgi:hypothetical protein